MDKTRIIGSQILMETTFETFQAPKKWRSVRANTCLAGGDINGVEWRIHPTILPLLDPAHSVEAGLDVLTIRLQLLLGHGCSHGVKSVARGLGIAR